MNRTRRVLLRNEAIRRKQEWIRKNSMNVDWKSFENRRMIVYNNSYKYFLVFNLI